MNKYHILIGVVLLGAFLATFSVLNSSISGLTVANSGVGLRVDTSTTENSIAFTWTTDTNTVSTLEFSGRNTAFSTATEFSKEFSGLSPGSEYSYKVRACSDNQCEEKRGTVTTKTGRNSITGAVAGGFNAARSLGSIPEKLKSSVSFVLYALVGVVIFIVAGRIGYEKFSKDPMQQMLEQGKKLVEQEEFEHANQMYAQAREAFSILEDEARLKHYDSLLQLYNSLKRHFDVQQAQKLAEKYSDGTITKEELQQLNELMAS